MKTPLHGTSTHPLSDHAIGVLSKLKNGPIARYKINPGVVDRLLREDLIVINDHREVAITLRGALASTAEVKPQ